MQGQVGHGYSATPGHEVSLLDMPVLLFTFSRATSIQSELLVELAAREMGFDFSRARLIRTPAPNNKSWHC